MQRGLQWLHLTVFGHHGSGRSGREARLEVGAERFCSASVMARQMIAGLSTYTANLCPIVGRPVTQDDAPPFCTVKAGTARGFREDLATNLRSPPDGASGAFAGNTARTKRRNERLSIGL
jgi:hypothetical protein